ncbi:isoaspartyl peptidase/L-asparaginase [Pontixanthobacter aestiaquae]|uniref:Isoaspartyl peptidase n=1 Tax=Pontixanthobacter aestiaquae TaxID=1509367 RepID=A0A844Z1E6_9SPHN|nr:isoaspartyl peptidase/L-asparaginase [Pontixanthobacter aestiaquae]MDN3647269.1 isoaspartyl peptidase/L-asparaginase [Pontixanthobacter aestiaquae]MXO81755.1 isoaspartyl peptidase/L-asparaginase [Pontixanthobacter aestiaquae]
MSVLYRIVIHGGAGVSLGRDYGEVESHLAVVIQQCSDKLENGETALATVEFAVAALETSGLYVAGRGSAPNSSGMVECDASIMDGAQNRAGGVCAVRDLVNPISAARLVLEQTPYSLLAGEGARAFAIENGCDRVADPDTYYRLPVGVLADELLHPELTLSHGTVGAVALDREGRLASATSTGGLFGKLAGRVGDTPLIGIGTWADENVAISCTGIGEAFISAGGARDIIARMTYGKETLESAADNMLQAVAENEGDGGLIALDREGRFVMPFNSDGMKRACAGDGLKTVVAIT